MSRIIKKSFLKKYLWTSPLDEYQCPTIECFDKVMTNLVKGLETIHQQQVAHRDIKPKNIMINPTNFDIKIQVFDKTFGNRNGCVSIHFDW